MLRTDAFWSPAKPRGGPFLPVPGARSACEPLLWLLKSTNRPRDRDGESGARTLQGLRELQTGWRDSGKQRDGSAGVGRLWLCDILVAHS